MDEPAVVDLERAAMRAWPALAVRDGPLLGLFDLGVEPALRGRGHGRRLLDGLLRWGIERGARCAYLQVLATNPAIRLYERTGFREVYRYGYRVRTE
jgi:ribosomal protein S18 acetylase RimI-like enzyme